MGRPVNEPQQPQDPLNPWAETPWPENPWAETPWPDAGTKPPDSPAQPFAVPLQRGAPEWAALAEQHANRSKRSRPLLIVSGILAVALASCAAYGLGAFTSGKAKKQPVAQDSHQPVAPIRSASPSPSQPAPPQAPLTADAVFSAPTVQIDGKTYTRRATSTTSPCWKVTSSSLGSALSADGCTRLLRATFVAGTSSITVAVAVLPTVAQAQAAAIGSGTINPLDKAKDGLSDFCHRVACAHGAAAWNTFAVFTIAGPSNDSRGDRDSASITASQEFATYTLTQLPHTQA